LKRADPQEYGPARRGVKPGLIDEESAKYQRRWRDATDSGCAGAGARPGDGRLHGFQPVFGALGIGVGGFECGRFGHLGVSCCHRLGADRDISGRWVDCRRRGGGQFCAGRHASSVDARQTVSEFQAGSPVERPEPLAVRPFEGQPLAVRPFEGQPIAVQPGWSG